jgi:hypothetical protein
MENKGAMSPGRPRKPPEQKRTIRKGVAFSQEEYDRLCVIAWRLGLEVNAFIRLMVIGVSDGATSTSEATSGRMAMFVREYR